MTPAFVRDAEVPSTERKIYWDTATSSFGLLVTCNNARSFVGDYRNADGVKRRKTWPARTEDKGAGLTIDDAKREFRKLRGGAERGHDPVQDEREKREKAKEEQKNRRPPQQPQSKRFSKAIWRSNAAWFVTRKATSPSMAVSVLARRNSATADLSVSAREPEAWARTWEVRSGMD